MYKESTIALLQNFKQSIETSEQQHNETPKNICLHSKNMNAVILKRRKQQTVPPRKTHIYLI